MSPNRGPAFYFDRKLTDKEIEELQRNPWPLLEQRKKQPVYKRNWFWFVALPTALVALMFVAAFLARGLS